MPRNDRESSAHNGRNQYGIGQFEQQQFERNKGPEVERSGPESVGRERGGNERDWQREDDRAHRMQSNFGRPISDEDVARERQMRDRRHGMFGRSHDDREDRRELFGQRGDADDHSGRWYGRNDRDDRSRYGAHRDDGSYYTQNTRDYRRDDDDQDRNWFDRARDNVRGWFRHDEDDDRRYRNEGYMSERDARRRYHMNDDERHGDHQVFGGRGLQAHDDPYEVRRDEERRFGTREEYYAPRSMGRDDLRLGPRYRAENMPGDDRYRREMDDRHRYTDTDDDQRHNWAAWSGRSNRNYDYRRDHSRDMYARDERYPQSYDDRYGHSSIRGNRLDYDQQFVSRADHHDDDRASDTRHRDDHGADYGRRRRRY